MFGLFGKARTEPSVAHEELAQPLPWRDDSTLPIPDWDRIDPPGLADRKELHQFWNNAAHAWLVELRARLGAQYVIAQSDEFMLLGAMPERQRKLALEYAEKTRNRVLKMLPEIAADEGYGKTIIFIFQDQDAYYRYVSNYYADVANTEELSLSSGMYINDGYGHFVFVADDLAQIEPVIAHELTHSLLAHLPLPAWVNEGIAVNTERRLCPTSRSRFTAPEVQAKFAEFWNASTIQEFWSGKAWRRPDEGNALSYELATTFVGLAARDWPAFAAFVKAANGADAGDTAALECLGYPLDHLADAVLGQGNWTPDPSRWKEGIERGQFRGRHCANVPFTTCCPFIC